MDALNADLSDKNAADIDSKASLDAQQQRIPVAQVVLRTITGLCHTANRRAIDWSSSGLVAYASHGVVVVVDPVSLQQVQVRTSKTNFALESQCAG